MADDLLLAPRIGVLQLIAALREVDEASSTASWPVAQDVLTVPVLAIGMVALAETWRLTHSLGFDTACLELRLGPLPPQADAARLPLQLNSGLSLRDAARYALDREDGTLVLARPFAVKNATAHQLLLLLDLSTNQARAARERHVAGIPQPQQVLNTVSPSEGSQE